MSLIFERRTKTNRLELRDLSTLANTVWSHVLLRLRSSRWPSRIVSLDRFDSWSGGATTGDGFGEVWVGCGDEAKKENEEKIRDNNQLIAHNRPVVCSSCCREVSLQQLLLLLLPFFCCRCRCGAACCLLRSCRCCKVQVWCRSVVVVASAFVRLLLGCVLVLSSPSNATCLTFL